MDRRPAPSRSSGDTPRRVRRGGRCWHRTRHRGVPVRGRLGASGDGAVDCRRAARWRSPRRVGRRASPPAGDRRGLGRARWVASERGVGAASLHCRDRADDRGESPSHQLRAIGGAEAASSSCRACPAPSWRQPATRQRRWIEPSGSRPAPVRQGRARFASSIARAHGPWCPPTCSAWWMVPTRRPTYLAWPPSRWIHPGAWLRCRESRIGRRRLTMSRRRSIGGPCLPRPISTSMTSNAATRAVVHWCRRTILWPGRREHPTRVRRV
jgi:hypothetical protein